MGGLCYIVDIGIYQYHKYKYASYQIHLPNGQWLRLELDMLIIDDTLLPLIAVFTLLDEFARLRKLRSVGDRSDASALSSVDNR